MISISCLESKLLNNNNWYGRFQLAPFQKGEGLTVANALRRTLLAEKSNFLITWVDFYNAEIPYSVLTGMRESIFDILLNLKQVIFTSDNILPNSNHYLQKPLINNFRAQKVKFFSKKKSNFEPKINSSFGSEYGLNIAPNNISINKGKKHSLFVNTNKERGRLLDIPKHEWLKNQKIEIPYFEDKETVSQMFEKRPTNKLVSPRNEFSGPKQGRVGNLNNLNYGCFKTQNVFCQNQILGKTINSQYSLVPLGIFRKSSNVGNSFLDTSNSKKIGKSTYIGYICAKGPAIIYAKNIKLPKGLKCVDPDKYIVTLADDGLFYLRFALTTEIKTLSLGDPSNVSISINQGLKFNAVKLKTYPKTLFNKEIRSCFNNRLAPYRSNSSMPNKAQKSKIWPINYTKNLINEQRLLLTNDSIKQFNFQNTSIIANIQKTCLLNIQIKHYFYKCGRFDRFLFDLIKPFKPILKSTYNKKKNYKTNSQGVLASFERTFERPKYNSQLFIGYKAFLLGEITGGKIQKTVSKTSISVRRPTNEIKQTRGRCFKSFLGKNTDPYGWTPNMFGVPKHGSLNNVKKPVLKGLLKKNSQVTALINKLSNRSSPQSNINFFSLRLDSKSFDPHVLENSLPKNKYPQITAFSGFLLKWQKIFRSLRTRSLYDYLQKLGISQATLIFLLPLKTSPKNRILLLNPKLIPNIGLKAERLDFLLGERQGCNSKVDTKNKHNNLWVSKLNQPYIEKFLNICLWFQCSKNHILDFLKSFIIQYNNSLGFLNKNIKNRLLSGKETKITLLKKKTYIFSYSSLLVRRIKLLEHLFPNNQNEISKHDHHLREFYYSKKPWPLAKKTSFLSMIGMVEELMVGASKCAKQWGGTQKQKKNSWILFNKYQSLSSVSLSTNLRAKPFISLRQLSYKPLCILTYPFQQNTDRLISSLSILNVYGSAYAPTNKNLFLNLFDFGKNIKKTAFNSKTNNNVVLKPIYLNIEQIIYILKQTTKFRKNQRINPLLFDSFIRLNTDNHYFLDYPKKNDTHKQASCHVWILGSDFVFKNKDFSNTILKTQAPPIVSDGCKQHLFEASRCVKQWNGTQNNLQLKSIASFNFNYVVNSVNFHKNLWKFLANFNNTLLLRSAINGKKKIVKPFFSTRFSKYSILKDYNRDNFIPFSINCKSKLNNLHNEPYNINIYNSKISFNLRYTYPFKYTIFETFLPFRNFHCQVPRTRSTTHYLPVGPHVMTPSLNEGIITGGKHTSYMGVPKHTNKILSYQEQGFAIQPYHHNHNNNRFTRILNSTMVSNIDFDYIQYNESFKMYTTLAYTCLETYEPHLSKYHNFNKRNQKFLSSQQSFKPSLKNEKMALVYKPSNLLETPLKNNNENDTFNTKMPLKTSFLSTQLPQLTDPKSKIKVQDTFNSKAQWSIMNNANFNDAFIIIPCSWSLNLQAPPVVSEGGKQLQAKQWSRLPPFRSQLDTAHYRWRPWSIYLQHKSVIGLESQINDGLDLRPTTNLKEAKEESGYYFIKNKLHWSGSACHYRGLQAALVPSLSGSDNRDEAMGWKPKITNTTNELAWLRSYRKNTKSSKNSDKGTYNLKKSSFLVPKFKMRKSLKKLAISFENIYYKNFLWNSQKITLRILNNAVLPLVANRKYSISHFISLHQLYLPNHFSEIYYNQKPLFYSVRHKTLGTINLMYYKTDPSFINENQMQRISRPSPEGFTAYKPHFRVLPTSLKAYNQQRLFHYLQKDKEQLASSKDEWQTQQSGSFFSESFSSLCSKWRPFFTGSLKHYQEKDLSFELPFVDSTKKQRENSKKSLLSYNQVADPRTWIKSSLTPEQLVSLRKRRWNERLTQGLKSSNLKDVNNFKIKAPLIKNLWLSSFFCSYSLYAISTKSDLFLQNLINSDNLTSNNNETSLLSANSKDYKKNLEEPFFFKKIQSHYDQSNTNQFLNIKPSIRSYEKTIQKILKSQDYKSINYLVSNYNYYWQKTIHFAILGRFKKPKFNDQIKKIRQPSFNKLKDGRVRDLNTSNHGYFNWYKHQHNDQFFSQYPKKNIDYTSQNFIRILENKYLVQRLKKYERYFGNPIRRRIKESRLSFYNISLSTKLYQQFKTRKLKKANQPILKSWKSIICTAEADRYFCFRYPLFIENCNLPWQKSKHLFYISKHRLKKIIVNSKSSFKLKQWFETSSTYLSKTFNSMNKRLNMRLFITYTQLSSSSNKTHQLLLHSQIFKNVTEPVYIDIQNKGSYEMISYFTIKESLNSIYKVNYIVESQMFESSFAYQIPPAEKMRESLKSISELAFHSMGSILALNDLKQEPGPVFDPPPAHTTASTVPNQNIRPQNSIEGAYTVGLRTGSQDLPKRFENIQRDSIITDSLTVSNFLNESFSFVPNKTLMLSSFNELINSQTNKYEAKNEKEYIQIDIWTNGELTPRQALLNAFRKLFELFYNLSKYNCLKPIEI